MFFLSLLTAICMSEAFVIDSKSFTIQNPCPTGTIKNVREKYRTGQVVSIFDAFGSRNIPDTVKFINAGCK